LVPATLMIRDCAAKATMFFTRSFSITYLSQEVALCPSILFRPSQKPQRRWDFDKHKLHVKVWASPSTRKI
jgi:hypothetical protein